MLLNQPILKTDTKLQQPHIAPTKPRPVSHQTTRTQQPPKRDRILSARRRDECEEAVPTPMDIALARFAPQSAQPLNINGGVGMISTIKGAHWSSSG